LIELDLSMGTMTNEGLFALLQVPETNDLDKLNLDENFIRTDIHVREGFNLKPDFITFAGTRFSSRTRYCSIRE
jgi:hypothetical protein